MSRTTEGTWFRLQPSGEHFLGVAARASRDGRVLFGYFFGPYDHAPTADDIDGCTPAKAALTCMFGDLHLSKGDWTVISGTLAWDREAWPIPRFCRHSELFETYELVTYDDRDPAKEIGSAPVDESECAAHPPDELLGSGVVETVLAGSPAASSNGTGSRPAGAERAGRTSRRRALPSRRSWTPFEIQGSTCPSSRQTTESRSFSACLLRARSTSSRRSATRSRALGGELLHFERPVG